MLHEIPAAVRASRASAVDVCRETLARIATADRALHAFRNVTAERALAPAAAPMPAGTIMWCSPP
jgi:Asp-tRNA(Asn)/Glu-tRNA(Gln) amidotransferase A subunit family amidase